MPWGEERFTCPSVTRAPATTQHEPEDNHEHRLAARRYFRAAPPYCIEFDATGAAVLSEKYYEYWPDREPEDATTWRPISRHQDLEEAERRLRLICGTPHYYDEEGRVVSKPPPRRRTTRWAMPPTDGE